MAFYPSEWTLTLTFPFELIMHVTIWIFLIHASGEQLHDKGNWNTIVSCNTFTLFWVMSERERSRIGNILFGMETNGELLSSLRTCLSAKILEAFFLKKTLNVGYWRKGFFSDGTKLRNFHFGSFYIVPFCFTECRYEASSILVSYIEISHTQSFRFIRF